MSPARKSPQEKKQREYADRVTPGNRRHAEARKDGKKSLIRETRNKSNELLAAVKPQISSEDAELLTGELTAAHLRKSVSRKRPMKSNAVPFSQVIEWQLERRQESFGRRTKAHPLYDKWAKESVETLNSIKGGSFVEVARRAGRLCSPDYRNRFSSELGPEDPVDRALHFLCRVASCSNEENQALCRNKDLDKTLTAWIHKANRVLAKDRLAAQRKIDAQKAVKSKSRASENK